MTSKVALQAVDCAPGELSYQLATSATSQRILIPADMRNVFCAFQARTEDVFIRFGGETVSVTITDVSTVASEVLTEDVNTPHLHVPAGQMRTARLEYGKFTHFAHRSAGATGYFIFGCWTGSGLSEDA